MSAAGGDLRRHLSGLIGFTLLAAVGVAGALAPFVAPMDPLELDLAARLTAPSGQHLLGTDQAGRDLLSRIIWGTRESLFIAFGAVALGLAVGVTLGLAAGFRQGTMLETIIMRTFDILFSIPLLVLAVAVIGVVGTGSITLGPITLGDQAKLIALIGLSFTPALGRVTYASTLVEAKSDYVRAKRSQGASWIELIFVEILPNVIPPVIVQATLFIGVAVIVEASLSFVGLGVQPPAPSWGTMLADARNYIFSGEWWIALFPGLAICITVVAFNLIGDTLRDLLDPRAGVRSGFI
ncbi:MAG: peptide/nickel transport system permease protein [Variibacter sp.]|nr:peptide/nickel transport system permease protein [Variibacter sp.]